MKNAKIKFYLSSAAVAIFILMAAGCGGGGGSSPAPAPAAAAGTGRVEGHTWQVVAGRMAGSATGTLRIPLTAAKVTCGSVSGATDEVGHFLLASVPVGRQMCSVSKQGYLVSQFSVTVVAGQTVSFDPDALAPEQSGTLAVVSTPEGGAILLDGFEVPATSTNTMLDPVIAGTHTVSVQLAGYEASTQTLEVLQGASATASFILTKLTTSITVAWDGSPVQMGETKQLAATCAYADGTSGDCTGAVEWTSSNAAAVTIAADGKMAAVAPGEAVISATRQQSKISFPGVTVAVACPGGQSWRNGACAVDTLQSIVIDPAALTVQAGNSGALKAKCAWTTAGEAPCPALTWTSAAASAVSVDNTGAVKGLAAGVSLVTASASGITSNQAAVTVPVALNPEPACDGGGGFCVDIVGVSATAGGTVALAVKLSGLPPAGIRGGTLTLKWDPAALTFASKEVAAGITLQADNSTEAGKYQIAFTSAAPLTGDTTLFTITLTAANGATGAPAVSWAQDFDKTNFTDGNFNLISQTGVTFKDAVIAIIPAT